MYSSCHPAPSSLLTSDLGMNQTTVGAVAPPPGITANSIQLDRVPGGIVPVSAVFLSLSTVFLALRLYTKIRIVPPIRADDYIVLFAWLLSVVYGATSLERQNKGNGVQLWDVPLDKLLEYGKWESALEFLYVLATALPKVAILISYLRIFSVRNFHVAVYSILSMILGYTIAICSVIFFPCEPAAESSSLHCILLLPYFWNGILNVVTDFMVLLVPIPMLVIWKVPMRRKLMTGGVFATGTSTCILSAVRTYFVWRLQRATDLTRAVVIPTSVSLSVAETNLAIICGCLMVARPFLRRHLPFIIGNESERVEPTWPLAVNHEQPFIVFRTAFEHRPNMSAVIGGANSSAGWIWGRKNGIDSRAIFGDDVERRGVRGWPLRNDILPRSDSLDNIIEESGTP
ncbi:hypothetical protein IMSHALPRED_005975 [Imshaugia aleurites]|uniref:Rhodopsin domain-containing protein n=1 Tax=Imshaugia aleurites TaxID=172621 RepID=A0A8H3FFN4_9LECA|nr:hypothetical protein IMSHALPRED_005975 [Imshaugia aleurites]